MALPLCTETSVIVGQLCEDTNDVIYTRTQLGDIPHDPSLFAAKFYSYGLGLIGGVGLLFLIFGAYLMITSQGNSSQVTKGKSYVTYAVVGIFLAILGILLIQLITVDLLHLPGFSP